jgi:tRNA dimethylallyltransferase
VRAITAGWVLPPAEPDPKVRARLEARAEREGAAALYAELLERDPEAADFVSPTNLRRIVRALEVCLTTGEPFSRSRLTRPPNLPMLKIALTMDRAALYGRVDRRADQMFERGLLAEVAGLLAAGYDPSSPAFTGIGYREAVACLRGELTAEQARDRLKFATHRYIRQQYAWLRREPGVHWIEVQPEAAEAAGEATAELVARFLAGGADTA